jgi:hypothetical protein
VKEWPNYRIARDLASGKVFPVSEALILQTARKHGIGRKMGCAISPPPLCTRNTKGTPCRSSWEVELDA